MKVVNSQMYLQDNDHVTVTDGATGEVYKHVLYEELRDFVLNLFPTGGDWDEVRTYILTDWDLGDDDYLNIQVDWEGWDED